MLSSPPPPVPANAGALSLSFGFLGGNGSGNGVAAGAANEPAALTISFGFLGGVPVVATPVAAAVGSGTNDFFHGSSGSMVTATAETSLSPRCQQ